jgi:hypothetical protein
MGIYSDGMPGVGRLIVPRFLRAPFIAPRWSPGYPCCCSAPGCVYCSGSTPLTLNLDFTGVVNGVCGTCATVNSTTYELAHTDGGGLCFWALDFNLSGCAGLTNMGILLAANLIVVEVGTLDLGGFPVPLARWEASETTPFNCQTYWPKAMTSLVYHRPGFVVCDFNSAVPTISLP